jgi:hypothetical protein
MLTKFSTSEEEQVRETENNHWPVRISIFAGVMGSRAIKGTP